MSGNIVSLFSLYSVTVYLSQVTLMTGSHSSAFTFVVQINRLMYVQQPPACLQYLYISVYEIYHIINTHINVHTRIYM